MRWLAVVVTATMMGAMGPASAEDVAGVGAQFLTDVIQQLKIDNGDLHQVVDIGLDRVSEITGPTPLPQLDHIGEEAPPPPPLSKEELAALYDAALQKGATLNLAAGGPLRGGLTPEQQLQLGLSTQQAQGYHYYFYPLKNIQQNQLSSNQMGEGDTTVTTMMTDDGGEKRVEPLFVAVSGFIGMALMFVVTVLFLPKFGNLRSRGISALKHAPQELGTLTKLVVEAIDGKNCEARVTCEVGRAVRSMKLNKKPLRVIQKILPAPMRKQVAKIRRAASKREKCEVIRCKAKTDRQSHKKYKNHGAVTRPRPLKISNKLNIS